MTTTLPAHRTYAAIAALAEPISLEELATLLERDDNPDVYEPHKQRKIAQWATLRIYGNGRGSVMFTYCDRKGFHRGGSISVGYLFRTQPVLHFEKLGRIVSVAAAA